VGSLRSLAREFSGRARLLTVYTVEAHAQDEWPISSCKFNRADGAACAAPVLVTQPRSDAERVQLAARFVSDFQYDAGEVAVDPPEAGDPFERAFAPWPFRFFGVRVGADGQPVMDYVAHPRDCGYSLAEVRDWLIGAT
jgi:hypothetical protein